VRILGPPTATLEDLLAGARRLGAAPLFLDSIAPNIWTAARRHCVDPAGAIAQAFKETNGGKFTGNVKAQFYNPAGIKVRHPGLFPDIPETIGDGPLAHSMFANWATGCEAMIQHLLAYTGCLFEDVGYLVIDPRVVFVIANNYRVETFEELGGKWAPNPNYGNEIVETLNRILGA